MIKFKKAIALAAALATITTAGAGVMGTNAATREYTQLSSSKSNVKIPNWVPLYFNQAFSFLNDYGNTLVRDNLACTVFKVSDAEDAYFNIRYDGADAAAIDEELIYADELYYAPPVMLEDSTGFTRFNDDPGFHMLVMVYDVKNFSNLEICVEYGTKKSDGSPVISNSTTYRFEKNGMKGGTILTQEDIFGWLPDCPKEFEMFRKANGDVSTHDQYLVYCGEVNPSTGSSLNIVQTGTADFEEKLSLNVSPIEFYPDDGASENIVKVFEATKAGNTDISFQTVSFDGTVLEEKKENITVDKKLIPHINSSDLPDWIPQDITSAEEFANTYGQTHVEDGYACIVQRIKISTSKWDIYASSTANVNEIYSGKEFEAVFNKKFTRDDDSETAYSVTVYKPEKSTRLNALCYSTGSADNTEFVFMTDEDGNVTEIDRFSWLPDCMTEYKAFKEKNGTVSIHDNFLVYCGEINKSTGYDLSVEYDGTTWFNQSDYYKLNDSEVPVPGAPDKVIILYEAERKGDTTVKFGFKPINGERENNSDIKPIERTFRVDNDLNIEEIDKKDKAPLLIGDCNYDGTVGIADVVILQEYILGRYDFINPENSDISGDGKINAFDLILLKRRMFDRESNYIAEPEPLMAVVYENHAWSDTQNMTIYDQNGNAYYAHYYSGEYKLFEDEMKGAYTDLINFSGEEDWYTKLKSLMTDENRINNPYKRLPDGVVYEARELMENYDNIKDSKMANGMTLRCDGGCDSIYVFGKSGDKPVNMELCMNGDFEVIRDNADIHDFVKTLIHEHIFSFMVDYHILMNGEYYCK